MTARFRLMLVVVAGLSHGAWAQDQVPAEALPHLETVKETADGGINHYEWAVLPVLAGSSDIGFEFGAFAVVTKLAPAGFNIPYQWSLQGSGAISINGKPGGGVELPVHDDFISLDWRSLDAKWRVNADVWFWQAANAGYYGVGNQSLPTGNVLATSLRTVQYVRSEFVASASTAYQPTRFFRFRAGLAGRRLDPRVYSDSSLALDLNGGAASGLLLGVRTQYGVIGTVGAELDTRDNEIAPNRGAFITTSVRGSPGPLTGTDSTFGGVDVHARGYVTLWPGRIVLAGRVLFDAVFGRPPMHDLSRSGGFDEVWMLGGSDGARGVPEGRYQGRIKLNADLEARVHIVNFELFDQRFGIGAVAFVDGGRVWADWVPRPDLDGTGLGLHVAVGGGVRVRIGDTILLRLDVAWSPPPVSTDEEPFGFYIDVGHAF